MPGPKGHWVGNIEAWVGSREDQVEKIEDLVGISKTWLGIVQTGLGILKTGWGAGSRQANRTIHSCRYTIVIHSFAQGVAYHISHTYINMHTHAHE